MLYYARHKVTKLYFNGTNFSAKTKRTARPLRSDIKDSDFDLIWGKNIEIVTAQPKAKKSKYF